MSSSSASMIVRRSRLSAGTFRGCGASGRRLRGAGALRVVALREPALRDAATGVLREVLRAAVRDVLAGFAVDLVAFAVVFVDRRLGIDRVDVFAAFREPDRALD